MYNMYVFNLLLILVIKTYIIKISSSKEKYVFSLHLIQKSWPTLVYIITRSHYIFYKKL